MRLSNNLKLDANPYQEGHYYKNKFEGYAEKAKALEEKLLEVANELEWMIRKENNRLKSKITSSDLDQPEYIDYQTVHEAHVLANGKFNLYSEENNNE